MMREPYALATMPTLGELAEVAALWGGDGIRFDPVDEWCDLHGRVEPVIRPRWMATALPFEDALAQIQARRRWERWQPRQPMEDVLGDQMSILTSLL